MKNELRSPDRELPKRRVNARTLFLAAVPSPTVLPLTEFHFVVHLINNKVTCTATGTMKGNRVQTTSRRLLLGIFLIFLFVFRYHIVMTTDRDCDR